MSEHVVPVPTDRRKRIAIPALMYGLLLAGLGFTVYFLGVMLRVVGLVVDPHGQLLGVIRAMIWYSGMPVVGGLILILFDLFVLLPRKRIRLDVAWDPPASLDLTVVLTA